jgi:hypothetical protein
MKRLVVVMTAILLVASAFVAVDWRVSTRTEVQPTQTTFTTSDVMAVQTETSLPQTPVIEFFGPIWNHTTLTVMLNGTLADARWLRPTLDAIQSWRTAIAEFADDYYYPYLMPMKNITFQVYLQNSNMTASGHYDITITYDAVSHANWVGLTTATSTDGMFNAVHILLTNGTYTDAFFQSLVAHELGHALGLGHVYSNGTVDLMNPYYVQTGPVQTVHLPTTLDLYALMVKYEWLGKGAFFNPIIDDASLPSSIPFEELSG